MAQFFSAEAKAKGDPGKPYLITVKTLTGQVSLFILLLLIFSGQSLLLESIWSDTVEQIKFRLAAAVLFSAVAWFSRFTGCG